MKKIKTFREDYWQGRRDFLARSAFLFAAMGLAPAVRFDLTEKLAKKMGIPSSTLMANGLVPSSGDKKFLMHWKFRSGAAFDQILFPMGIGSDMNRLNGGMGCQTDTTLSRLAYNHRPDEQVSVAGSLPGTQVHFTKWAENLAPLVEQGKFNVASTVAVVDGNGHTGDYSMAKGGSSANAPDPAVLMAGLYGGNVSYPGIEWRQGDSTVNQTGTYAALQRIDGNTNQSEFSTELPVMVSNQARNFLNLFTPAVLPFSKEQVSLIAGVSEKININYAARSANQDPDSLILTAKTGTEALSLDLKEAFLNPLISDPSLREAFDMETTNPGGQNLQIRLGEASYLMLNAFAYGATRASTMSITTGDWHSYLNDASGNPNSDLATRMESRHAQFGVHFAKIIQAIFEYAETLPNPFTTDGSTLADAVNILMTTEFIRGAQKSNCDNIQDRQRDGFVMLGRSVNNITGGDWNPAGGGSTVSFNKQTGVNNPAEPMITHGECYATFCRAAGIPAEKIDDAGISNAPVFAMLSDDD